MQVRAIIRENSKGYVGWLVELPGIYAEGNTSGQVLEALHSAARRLLAMDFSADAPSQCALIDIPTGGDH